MEAQSKGLAECRQILTTHGFSTEALKKAEDALYKRGYVTNLPGLAGLLQRICPLCTDQMSRDVRGFKKRAPTKLKKKLYGYRPHFQFTSNLLRFSKDAVVPPSAKAGRPRRKAPAVEETKSVALPVHTVAAVTESVPEERASTGTLDVAELEKDLLGGFGDVNLDVSQLELDLFSGLGEEL